MAWGIHVEGMQQLFNAFDKLPDKARKIASEALYEGAGVVADAVSSAVQGIATEPFKYAKNGHKRLASPEEKAMLTSSRHGVAKFRKGAGNVQTSVGFQRSGYAPITWNHAKTGASRTKYKQSASGRMVHASQGSGTSMKPIPLIANSINHGTSFMVRQPFLNKAFSKSKGAATAAMENGLQSRLDELSMD